LFAILMMVQWVATIVIAIWVFPKTLLGASGQSQQIWVAVVLGTLISGLPIFLGLRRSGITSTRYTIAVCQMLMGSLLIHLTGGRIETHFHVFGSLAFLSFYRDWRLLISATLVTTVDHL